MKNFLNRGAYVFSFFCLYACGHTQTNLKRKETTLDPFSSQQTSAVRFHTEESLTNQIRVGMSKDALISVLGSPRKTSRSEGGDVRFYYSFETPEVPGPRRYVVTGISVYLRDDKVTRWVPSEHGTIGGDKEGNQPIRIPPKRSPTSQVASNSYLTFWVVSDRQIEGGRYIDTELMPKLGFIAKEPSLRILRLKELLQEREAIRTVENNESEKLLLEVGLVLEDAMAFEKLTKENQGKKLLIMVGETPVMDATIFVVISKGQFKLLPKDQKAFNELRDKLAELLVSQ